MKILVLIVVLGAIAFLWHRQQVDQLSSDVQSAQAALAQAEESLARQAAPAPPAVAASAGNEVEILRQERDALQGQVDALRAEVEALRAPAAPLGLAYDTSPMASFAYDGTRLIEAKITSITADGVTITGKNGRSVVVDLETAAKMPDVRIRAQEAIEAELARSRGAGAGGR